MRLLISLLAFLTITVAQASPTTSVQWGYDPADPHAVQYKVGTTWFPMPLLSVANTWAQAQTFGTANASNFVLNGNALNANGGLPTVSVSATAPATPSLFQPWLNTTASPSDIWSVSDGVSWINVAEINTTLHTITFPTLNLAATPSGGFGGVSGILPAANGGAGAVNGILSATGTGAVSASSNLALGTEWLRFAEPNGVAKHSWNNAPIYFDLSDGAANGNRGINCFSVLFSTTAGVRNKGCGAFASYAPPDNGGDVSTFYLDQSGGGNTASLFNYSLDTPWSKMTGYTSGTTMTVVSLSGQLIWPTEKVWQATDIVSGTYTSSTGAVSIILSANIGLTQGSSFTIINAGPIGNSFLNGTYTATAGTSGTTLNFTAATGYGNTSTITGSVGNTSLGSGTTIVSQLSGSAGQAGTYQLSAASTVGSAGSPVTLMAQFPTYPNNGFVIEAQSDGNKHAVFASAENGYSFLGVSSGQGGGLLLQQNSRMTQTNRAISVQNSTFNGENIGLNWNGSGFFGANIQFQGTAQISGNSFPTTGAGLELAYDSTLGNTYVQAYDRNISAFKQMMLNASNFYFQNGSVRIGSAAVPLHPLDVVGVVNASGGFLSGSSTLLTTSVALTNGVAAQTATLTNGPVAGNPTKWVPINDNGVTRYIPAW